MADDKKARYGGLPQPEKSADDGEYHNSEAEAEIGAAIGKKLRKLYGDIASEPVPDRFADLLKQLEQDKSGSNDS